MTTTALVGGTILRPACALSDHALLLKGREIEAIVPLSDIPQAAERHDIGGLTVAPGFIDLQVNGGGGVLFNDAPTAASIARIAEAHRPFGTTSLLPTLISDTAEKMAEARAATAEAIQQATPGVIGLHLEGPFLSTKKHGIHDPHHFRQLADASDLAPPEGGRLMMTVAPEEVPAAVIRDLTARGIRVAAGHTNATYDQAREALLAGVTGFTHLFNAMPPMLSREPGVVAAALESDAWCTLIADGHHVDDAMLRLAIRAKIDGRMILVTDAMSCAGTDSKSFKLGDKLIRIRTGRCEDDAGTLAGSNLTMIAAVRHAVEKLRLPLHKAVSMASHQPAAFLGIENKRGTIRAGALADLIFLDTALNVVAVAQDGNLRELFT